MARDAQERIPCPPTPFFLQCRLGCRQACYRHPEGAATHVRKPDAMTELHAFRVSTVFATDAQLNVRPGFSAQITGHLHQLSNTRLVNRREGIVLDDLQFPRIQAESCPNHHGSSPKWSGSNRSSQS